VNEPNILSIPYRRKRTRDQGNTLIDEGVKNLRAQPPKVELQECRRKTECNISSKVDLYTLYLGVGNIWIAVGISESTVSLSGRGLVLARREVCGFQVESFETRFCDGISNVGGVSINAIREHFQIPIQQIRKYEKEGGRKKVAFMGSILPFTSGRGWEDCSHLFIIIIIGQPFSARF
jgi:hypothetical protein